MPAPLNLFSWLVIAAFVAGFICDVLVIQRFAAIRTLNVPAKPWGVRELFAGAALVLSAMMVVNGLYALCARVTRQDFDALMPVIVPAELVLRVGMLIGFVAFFRKRRVSVLGLDQIPATAALGWGAIFGLASLPPIGFLLYATDVFCRYIGINPSEQPVAELFLNSSSHFLLGSLTLFALVVAPAFEEVFFRGFAYPALKQRLGTGRALVIVSVAFAATHLHAPSFIPLFALSLALGLAYELTGSLLTPLTMHSLFNGLMVVRLFYQRAHS